MRMRTAAKAARDVVFRGEYAQKLVRLGARRGMLPRAFFTRILPVGAHPIPTPGGREVLYVADANDPLARHVVWPTGWERESLSLYSDLARGARQVLDVGAFTGIYSLFAAADSDAHVVAFEPNPSILQNLHRNIAANGMQSRITVHGVAVSEASGVATLSVPSADPTSANIADGPGDGVEVRVETLDGICRDMDVGLVKMDVEGLEESALLGGRELIQRCHPHIIVELLDEDAHRRVSSLLRNWGYPEVLRLGSGGLTPGAEYVYEPFHANYYFPAP